MHDSELLSDLKQMERRLNDFSYDDPACEDYEGVFERTLRLRFSEIVDEINGLKRAVSDLTKQRDILAASLQAVDCAEWLDLLLRYPTLMNNPTGVSFALYGCVPIEDICSAHDLPLECSHCCASGDKHECQPALEALK